MRQDAPTYIVHSLHLRDSQRLAVSLRQQLAAWLSGSALVSINEVTLRRAELVGLLGRVTVCIWTASPVCDQPLRPTQPSTLSETENEYHIQSVVTLCGWG